MLFRSGLKEIGKVCDHFHLSLQSGSDTVLNRMNRKYTSSVYKDKVDIIRRYMPNAGITTDIIVGFPGESEEEFNETCDFVREIGFSRIHVFKYSPRKGTPAASLENQIDGNIKNMRSEILIDLGERVAEDFRKRFIEKNLEVLFEEENKKISNAYEGYTTNYLRVRTLSDKSMIGNIKNISINGTINDILIGKKWEREV